MVDRSHGCFVAAPYEDYVLGKFAADMSLERASDELQKYKDRERTRALGFAIQQIQLRADLPGVLVGPAALKTLMSTTDLVLQKLFYESLARGFSRSVIDQWDQLIQAVRNSGELLGSEISLNWPAALRCPNLANGWPCAK